MHALRYEFTDEAIMAAHIFGLEHMDALVSGMRWLRPLAPMVWIEFDVQASLRDLRSRYGEIVNLDPPQGSQVSRRCGYLISSSETAPNGSNGMLVRVVTISEDGWVNLPHIGVFIFSYPGQRDPLQEPNRKSLLRWTVGVEPWKGPTDDPLNPAYQLMNHFSMGVLGRPPPTDDNGEYRDRVYRSFEES